MHDLRDALRALRAAPVVTVMVILSLALGANRGRPNRSPHFFDETW